jgi:hypothetical protein
LPGGPFGLVNILWRNTHRYQRRQRRGSVPASLRHGLEGTVSKRIDTPYRSGLFLSWRNIRYPGYARSWFAKRITPEKSLVHTAPLVQNLALPLRRFLPSTAVISSSVASIFEPLFRGDSLRRTPGCPPGSGIVEVPPAPLLPLSAKSRRFLASYPFACPRSDGATPRSPPGADEARRRANPEIGREVRFQAPRGPRRSRRRTGGSVPACYWA